MPTLPPRVFAAGCEANHTNVAKLALICGDARPPQSARIESMKARRMAYWWFRFVVSGRFLEKFLKLRRPWSIAAAMGRMASSLSPTIFPSGRCHGARNVASERRRGLAPNGLESGKRSV